MTAGELAIILAHVDPALPVTINGRHVVMVTRTIRRIDSYMPPPYPKVIPAGVTLGTTYGGREARWFDPAPPPVLFGPFRRRPDAYGSHIGTVLQGEYVWHLYIEDEPPTGPAGAHA